MPAIVTSWQLVVPEAQLPDVPLQSPETKSFTDTEISSAVAKIVQDSIRRPYGILGERKTLDTFDDTMDAAAGVFILQPASPFYVLLLATRRLLDTTTAAISSAFDLLDAIEGTGRRVRPVTNLTALGNARSALAALEAASGQRESVFEDINAAPAFQRFELNADRFLNAVGPNVKSSTNIARTPQQARKSLGTLSSTLVASFQDIQRRLRLIYDGIDNYNSLSLPALLAQGVISKARSTLDSRFEQLESMTPTERLEILRETVLDVLTSKAVVKGFGSLTKSGQFVPIEGNAVLYTDTDHPGEPALVESSFLDPYVIVEGADQLRFELDGTTTTVTIPLQRSFVAKLEGVIRESFVIVNDQNDKLRIRVTNAGVFTTDLTAGTRTTAQIVDDINAAITDEPIVAESYLAPEKFTGHVTFANPAGIEVDMVKTGDTWASLDVQVGDAVLVQGGSMNQLYFNVISRSGTTIRGSVVGAGTPLAASDVLVSVGPSGRLVRIRFADGEEVEALELSKSIQLVPDTDDSAAATLGFADGMEIFSRRTRADEIALSINSSSSASVAGVARVVASTTYVGSDQVLGRTEPSDPSKVVSTIYTASGTVTASGPSPTIFAVTGAASAGVAVGHIVTIRSSSTSVNTGLFGAVTLVSDTEVRANIGGLPALNSTVGLEFGLDLDPQRDQVIRVLSPSPIAGDYRILSSVNPTEATLDRPVPIYFGAGNRPVTFQMQLGSYRVDFASTSTDVASRLTIDGSASPLFFLMPPAEALGSTRYVLLEKDPKVLEFGDVLEFHSGQYQEPETGYEIIGFERGQKLLEVNTPIPNNYIEFDFEFSIDTPFARIRKVQRNNYDAFHTQIGLWLKLAVNGERYVSDLNRFLNPLVVNENPTASAVNTAKIHVQALAQALQQLQVILLTYQVDVVPQVDTLIDSFLSRGSDRAVDTLLEGRFTEFFGYNSEEVSYLGNALERLRDVSRLDLPVRRTQRKAVVDQELTLGEFEDPDFEFDQSDIQDNDEPDIPGSFIEVPGSNF